MVFGMKVAHGMPPVVTITVSSVICRKDFFLPFRNYRKCWSWVSRFVLPSNLPNLAMSSLMIKISLLFNKIALNQCTLLSSRFFIQYLRQYISKFYYMVSMSFDLRAISCLGTKACTLSEKVLLYSRVNHRIVTDQMVT